MRRIHQTTMNFFKFKTQETDKYEATIEYVLDTHEGCSQEKGLQNKQQTRIFLSIENIDDIIKQLTTAKAVMLKDAVAEEEDT